MEPAPITAKTRYGVLRSIRAEYLTRAREAAKLTLPSFNYDESPVRNPSKTRRRDYQSIGARGVNNLAAKLHTTMLPLNQPILRLDVDPEVYEDEDGSVNAELQAAITKDLSRSERKITRWINRSRDRSSLAIGWKHLLIAGNVMLFRGEDGTRAIPLNRYVVRRDHLGRMREGIIEETVSLTDLDEATALFARQAMSMEAGHQFELPGLGQEQPVPVYTWIRRDETQWHIHQEIAGQTVPGSEWTAPLDAPPYIALRLNPEEDSSDYGFGYCDEYLGDLKSVDVLSRALVEGAAAAARVLYLVKPAGSTSPRVIAEGENGGVYSGNAEDVTILHLEKAADLATAQRVLQEITTRLEFAFLLNTAVQRNGERVTAEEVRYMAQELESALGGIYTILNDEFQLPYGHLEKFGGAAGSR